MSDPMDELVRATEEVHGYCDEVNRCTYCQRAYEMGAEKTLSVIFDEIVYWATKVPNPQPRITALFAFIKNLKGKIK